MKKGIKVEKVKKVKEVRKNKKCWSPVIEVSSPPTLYGGKKAKIWKLNTKNIIAFTSIKPLSYKQAEFDKNIPLLLKSLEIKPEVTAFAKQVHGGKVLEVKSKSFASNREADGLVTVKKDVMLLIFTADCLPVFIYDQKTGATGITHCGWRSTEKNIIGKAVEKLKKYGSKTNDLRFVLGPRIKECCYEVGPEFTANFQKKYKNTGVYTRKGKLHFSLSDIVKLQLKKLGIPAKNVVDTARCTCCEKKSYFSYRRDGAGTGRMVSGIIAR